MSGFGMQIALIFYGRSMPVNSLEPKPYALNSEAVELFKKAAKEQGLERIGQIKIADIDRVEIEYDRKEECFVKGLSECQYDIPPLIHIFSDGYFRTEEATVDFIGETYDYYHLATYIGAIFYYPSNDFALMKKMDEGEAQKLNHIWESLFNYMNPTLSDRYFVPNDAQRFKEESNRDLLTNQSIAATEK